MIRTSLKKEINLEKTAGEPYQGISSLYLSAGAEYKKGFKETNLADGKYGGIQLWYRGSLKNAAPCGTVTLLHGENAVLSWQLADVLNSERLTDAGNRLTFRLIQLTARRTMRTRLQYPPKRSLNWTF